MRVGLVELHVDLCGRQPACLRDAVMKDTERDAKVRAAVADACRQECEIVLFPGWTVVAEGVPAWLSALSKDCTLIFECVPPDQRGSKTIMKQDDDATFDGRFHVLRDGRLLLKQPARQVLAGAGQIAARGDELARELGDSGKRRWTAGSREALLIVCGEVNVVSGGGSSRARWDRKDLPESDMRGGRLILNPAHTRMAPQAVRDKQAWLSRRGGFLLTTANVYAGTSRSSHRAADAWTNGRRAPRSNVRASANGHAVHVVSVPR